MGNCLPTLETSPFFARLGLGFWGSTETISEEMAAPAQSYRFGGPATTAAAAGNIETLNRVLADLCTRGAPKVNQTVCFHFLELFLCVSVDLVVFC